MAHQHKPPRPHARLFPALTHSHPRLAPSPAQSAAFVSMPSLLDPSAAPAGRHAIHAYLPATEPYGLWEGVRRGTPEYDALKRERAEPLFRAIERFVPDIRDRVEVRQHTASTGARCPRMGLHGSFTIHQPPALCSSLPAASLPFSPRGSPMCHS